MLSGGFPKNAVMISGIALLGIGILTALIGLGAFVNYTQVCLVEPGGFPCIDRYQVALLAPLYPLSGAIFVTGILIVALGFIFTFLSLSRLFTGRQPKTGTRVLREEAS